MRLSEITDAPCRHGNDCEVWGEAFSRGEEVERDVPCFACRRNRSRIETSEGHDRNNDQREEHQESLKHIGPADRQIPAENRIAEKHRGGNADRPFVIQMEHGFEELGGSDKSRSGIDREKQQGDDCRENAQNSCRVTEPAAEKSRESQRFRLFRIDPQARRDDEPVEKRPESKSDCNPCLIDARHIYYAGESHQQPSAHVARLRRERRDPASQSAASQQIGVDVL